MNKNDLKNGMMVETKNGKRWLVVENIERNGDQKPKTNLVSNNGYNLLEYYNDDLTAKTENSSDISSVYIPDALYSIWKFFKEDYSSFKRIWYRETSKETVIKDDIKETVTLGNRSVELFPGEMSGLWHVKMSDEICSRIFTYKIEEEARLEADNFLHRFTDLSYITRKDIK
jgi:hypothetical protein